MSWDKSKYKEIYERRLNILRDIRADKTDKTAAAYWKYYKDHNIEFIETWITTYDPRQPEPYIPFLLFPKQKEYIQWLDDLDKDRENGLVEKARDGGYTWCSCVWASHRWLFFPGQAIGFGSRKEDLVDRIGVSDSIMEKVRIIIRNLPIEFRPKGYKERQHAGFMKIINPVNGSSIIGESGDNIGRGGRTSAYFKDESAHYERPEKIEAALSENTDMQVDISSVNGEGNVFHRRRFGGAVRVFIHDWRDDPRKDQAWYDKKKSKAMAEGLEHIFAQEIDRDYAASVEGVFIPAKWVKAAVDFECKPSGIRQAGLDPDDEGKDGKALVIRHGSKVLSCKFWHKGDTTETARDARFDALSAGCQLLAYDATGVGAGIKGELKSLDNESNEKIRHIGVHNGSKKLSGKYEDTDRLNSDLFENIRAMNMWKLRRRFEKVYERVNNIKQHPIDECISIINDPELISEVSRPKRLKTNAGKILVESKAAMRARGIPSPNRLDGLNLAFHEDDGFFESLDW